MVKFGLRLVSTLNPQWSTEYVAYNQLKRYIPRPGVPFRPPTPAAGSDGVSTAPTTLADDAETEAEFLRRLKEEVAKVDNFYADRLRTSQTTFSLLENDLQTQMSTNELVQRDLQNRIIKYYVELAALREYATLNYTSITKILKKHDKYMPTRIKAEFLKSEVDNKPVFGTLDELHSLLARTRNLFADQFKQGNRKAADEDLEEAVKYDLRARSRRTPESILSKQCFFLDMDGVVYHGDRLLPNVKEFVAWLVAEKKKYLFLTNGSVRTPTEIQAKLKRLGLEVPPDVFHTSAISTAMFLQSQTPHGSAYVVGDNGLRSALLEVGFMLTDTDPDYVVVGETNHYTYEMIEKAINLVYRGARLIATNCDAVDNATHGFSPACGALVAPIERATGKQAYYLGKPNAIMFRTAAAKVGMHSSECIMVGDRMDTDIVGGMEAGMDTILVLSGITKQEDIPKFSFRPTHVLKGLGDILNLVNVHD